MKKVLAIVICFVMILTTFMSCDSAVLPNETDTDGETQNGNGAGNQETQGTGKTDETNEIDETNKTDDTDKVTETETEAGPRGFYETYYVDPDSVKITDKDRNAKNLIFIYLESMETTYTLESLGGSQTNVNYIPNLLSLANANISFSDSDGLGGFHSINGTGWTMGALLGTTSGIPFSLEVFGENSHNKQGRDGTFINGATTLGDVLHDKGYVQEFLCGSDAAFGGRKTYFTVHGGYEIFDLFTARKKGYVPSDYHNGWWGYEDEILYEIAKDEITRLAKGDKPFNFTMLTVDTHRPSGYKCNLCKKKYPYNSANVVDCADAQIGSFIEWCKKQDFYKDTTIVIIGDHPRMDKNLVSTADMYDRTIYNCIINSVVEPKGGTQNRTFTSLDIFPTTLAAMGFEIEGDRLALGTNIFSTKPTLCEENAAGKAGYDWLEAEASKYSEYYKKKFVDNKD